MLSSSGFHNKDGTFCCKYSTQADQHDKGCLIGKVTYLRMDLRTVLGAYAWCDDVAGWVGCRRGNFIPERARTTSTSIHKSKTL